MLMNNKVIKEQVKLFYLFSNPPPLLRLAWVVPLSRNFFADTWIDLLWDFCKVASRKDCKLWLGLNIDHLEIFFFEGIL